jgi:predicted Fe-Mo cluster-binding NifX family protein
VDTDTGQFEALDNPAAGAGGGAGIQAAQFVIGRGVQALLTGNVGPNAYRVFNAAGIAIFLVSQGTVAEAVEAYKAGRLPSASGATVPGHAGLGRPASHAST